MKLICRHWNRVVMSSSSSQIENFMYMGNLVRQCKQKALQLHLRNTPPSIKIRLNLAFLETLQCSQVSKWMTCTREFWRGDGSKNNTKKKSPKPVTKGRSFEVQFVVWKVWSNPTVCIQLALTWTTWNCSWLVVSTSQYWNTNTWETLEGN